MHNVKKYDFTIEREISMYDLLPFEESLLQQIYCDLSVMISYMMMMKLRNVHSCMYLYDIPIYIMHDSHIIIS